MNSPNPDQHPHYDDEISLYDLWDVLVRRLWVMVLVFVLVVAGGATYAFTQPTVYEYRSGIELARVATDESDGPRLVTDRDAAIALLEDVIIPDQREALAEAGEEAPRVSLSERGSSHVVQLRTTAQPENVGVVRSLHESITAALAEEQAPRLEQALTSRLRPLESRKARLQEHIALLDELREEIAEKTDLEDTIQSLIASQQISDIRRERAEALNDLEETRATMENLQQLSNETRLDYVVQRSENQVGTPKRLTLALSIVLGGMLALFGAFIVEFVVNAHRRRKAP